MGEVIYEPLIRDMTWSYSRIMTFEDCPYRFYLKYIRFPRANGKRLFFADYGTFVHELIADYYAGRKSASDVELEYLLRFRDKVPASAPNGKIFSGYFSDGLNYLKNIKPPEGPILSLEQKEAFSVSGIPFVGYIDRVDKGADGSLRIVDNKSRTLRPRSKRSAPTKSDKELDRYLRQLYLYSVPVLEKYGRFPDKLCFNCFRNGLVIEEPFREETYRDTLSWASGKIDEIAKERDFRPDMEYFKCRYLCEMQDYCEYYELSRR